jgi:hypothetical protein
MFFADFEYCTDRAFERVPPGLKFQAVSFGGTGTCIDDNFFLQSDGVGPAVGVVDGDRNGLGD